jgi:hypothetical protein
MNSMRRSGLLWIWLVVSCGHTQSAEPPAAHAETQPAESVASTQNKAPPPPPQDSIESFMAEHFAIVTWARDSVIAGNLEALREPLQALAKYEYRSVAPGGWMPYVAQLQQAAGLTAGAANLDLAASGVATMARVCGECHAAKAGGPKYSDVERQTKPTARDSLGERMQRHIWAADRMWEGLTAPSDNAWQAGAQALVDLPQEAPKSVHEPQIAAALHEVREVGERALEASTLKDRADAYGLFLSTCANCHQYAVAAAVTAPAASAAERIAAARR